ncbi:formate dehydrogenase accessory protein FdhE [Pseudomonas aeruginosa]
MAGMIRRGGKETGLRYLSCSLCACEWHYMRIKCSHCEASTWPLSLELTGGRRKKPCRAGNLPQLPGLPEAVLPGFDRHADTLADDLASLALDMRLAEDGYLRRSPNLLLAPPAAR